MMVKLLDGQNLVQMDNEEGYIMNIKQDFTEESDKYIFHLEGLQISRCCLDYAFSFEVFDSLKETTIRIESSFTLSQNDSKFCLTPSKPEDLGPVYTLFGEIISKIHMYKTGVLHIVFGNGAQLQVNPSDKYEAWEILNTQGVRVVCMPSGKLAVWGDSR